MSDMDRRHKHRMIICLAILFLCLIAIFLGAKEKKSSSENIIFYAPNQSSLYFDAMNELFPEYEIKAGNGQVLSYLEKGNIAQSMDTQAEAMISEWLAKYWYPQFMSTVIIAVDREQTDKQITGWYDLINGVQQISILTGTHDMWPISFAMAYGLEGEDYTAETAVKFLKILRKDGLLRTNKLDSPILICYDYQAVFLKKSGRDLDIIIPREGTFSYVSGLLSNIKLTIPDDMDEKLLSAGLRLPDGRCDWNFYPNAAAYKPAVTIPDVNYYNMQSFHSQPILRREGFGVRLYSSADAREHQILSSLLIIFVLVWAATVVNRAMQKRVKRGAIATAALLVGWILLRLIKWQINFETALPRYLWYTYIPFQILLSFIVLWLAWGIDKPEEKVNPPLWLWMTAILNIAAVLLVFTNDLHGFVYVLDLSQQGWLDDYTYGMGYYFIIALFLIQFSTAIGMLIVRCIRSPRKRGLIFPLLLHLLLIAYGYGYINRIPIAYESDLAMVFAVLSILFFEASIRSGMIPVNSKYIPFFTNSPLPMQIIDDTGDIAISSKNAMDLDNETLSHILSSNELFMQIDEDTLMFSKAITGGFSVWHEDISKLNILYEQIAESVKKSEKTNEVLTKSVKIKQEIEEENARNQLMDGLEAEISEKLTELQDTIKKLSESENKKKGLAIVAMSFCYIKRRSDFFFSEQENLPIDAAELEVYMDELSEYATLAGVNARIINEIKGAIPARIAVLFYNFLEEILSYSVKNSNGPILVRLRATKNDFNMWLMLSNNDSLYKPNHRLNKLVQTNCGKFEVKDLDDAVGIGLSFTSKGGESNA